MIKKSKKLTAALVLGVCLAAAAPSAFALNTAGDGTGNGNKPFSFTGYRYLDNGASADTLELNFNKDCTSPGALTSAMFTVKQGVTPVSISSVSISVNGDYDGGSHYTKGSKAVITFNGELADDTEYTVTINNLAMDKNGLTLGNYMNRKDLTFKFRTPTSGGAYTGDPYVTYVVGDPSSTTTVSWESDLTVIFDRPMYSSQVATYKSGLNSNYEKYSGGSWGDVSLYFGSGSGHEAYQVQSNDTNSVNTVFYFPETKNTSGTNVYNRSQSSNQYRLTLPTTFYDVNNRPTTAYTGGGSSFTFTTVSSDYPGWEANGNPNTALSYSNGVLTWTPSAIDNAPTSADGYDVWYTTGDKVTGTYVQIDPLDITYGTSGSNFTATFTPPQGATYYRLVPTNGTGSVGFSISN